MLNNNEEILNKEKIMEKTVEDLEQYYRFPSNDFLMLSELIDNSISSYISKKGMDNMSGLTIDITIDRRNKENQILTVLDNAYGMTAEVLENAIYFGNPYGYKKNSPLNVYGVGLKQAAFYSGRRLDVITKTEEYSNALSTYIDLIELETKRDKRIIFSIIETQPIFLKMNGTLLNSGTKIIISHLRKSRFALDSNKDIFLQSLGWKYNRYLKNGLNLILNYLTNEEKSTFKENVVPSSPKAENYSEFVEQSFKYYPKKGKPDYLNFIKNSDSDWNVDREYDEFMGKIVSGNDLIWKNIEIPITSDISVYGKIGILAHSITINKTKFEKQKWTKFNGFSLYQGGRAIKMGPNEEKLGISNYNVISKDIAGGINQQRRWFGEFDLDPLMEGSNKDKYIELDSNKRDIKWLDSTAEDRFKNYLKDFIQKFDENLTFFNNFQNSFIKTKKENEKKSNDIIAKHVKSSSKIISIAEIVESYSNNDQIKYEIDLLDLGFTKKISVFVNLEDDVDVNDQFVSYKKLRTTDEDSYSLSISININHNIWKPLLGEKANNDIQISLHKLAIVQGISQWILDYVTDEDNNLNENPEFFGEYKNKNYTEIFSSIANNIF